MLKRNTVRATKLKLVSETQQFVGLTIKLIPLYLPT